MVEKLHPLANLTPDSAPAEAEQGEAAAQSRADLSAIVQAHEDWLDTKGRSGERADLEEGRLAAGQSRAGQAARR